MPKIISRDALIDVRPQALKDKDYSTAEILTSAVETFQNKKIKKLGATEYNQWYAGSCVPHAFWTQLEYEGIIEADFNPSQLRSYRKRNNYPNAGSNGVDMYDQIKDGQSNDFPTPERFTEAKATAMPYIRGDKLIKDFKYYQYIENGQLILENIPADVASGKTVSIFIYASDNEWSKEYVEATENVSLVGAEVRHAVCLIPSGDFTEDGKKWLAVHDSAKFGGRHLRYISYDFLLRRCYFAAKVVEAGREPTPEPQPDTTPLVACEMGQSGQMVTNLQHFLIKEGKLEPQYATGYYGALTAKAVLWWQLEHWGDFTANIPQLLDWGGKYWGQGSIDIISNK